MNDLWINFILRFQGLTWTDWLDLALVTLVFFVLVNALQRAQATFILRGLALIGFLLLVAGFLLPLPTFNLLVRGILVFLLIAIPVVFQRELRHLLEHVGRRIGFAPSPRRETEELIQPLVRAVATMASQRIGALTVLQGEMDLDEIAETGVAIGGRVSSELLASIFSPKNPLHDGAALISGQTLVAAACVLPISRREINHTRRLGTRHRAALGLSERTDALILVVSEETGDISIAQNGALQQIEDQAELRECLVDFARRTPDGAPPGYSLRSLFNPETGRLRRSLVRRLRDGTARLAMAALLAVGLWWFVLTTSGSLPDVEVADVPLQVEGQPPGFAVANELPESVDLVVRTTEEASSAVNQEAFVARVSLDEQTEGIHRLPVAVTARLDAPVQIVDVEPSTVEVDLARIVERTLPVIVQLEESGLAGVYEVEDEPRIVPETVAVNGPQPLVEQVSEVRATLPLSSSFGLLESVQPLVALDAEGEEVQGVTLHPAETEVAVDVVRRPNVREVGVAIITGGEPAQGFWVSGLAAQPSTVVLSGPQDALATVGSAVPTAELDLSGAAGDVSVDLPLELPPEISVRTVEGEPLRSVQVTARVTARRGSLTIERPVEVTPADASSSLTLTAERVELLLSGPTATLSEIQADPNLVRVVLDVSEVAQGDTVDLMPRAIVPEGIGVQLVPSRITVSRP